MQGEKRISVFKQALRAAPVTIGAVMLGMTQVGSKEAEANFCSFFTANEECLRGLPVEVIQIIAILLILIGVAWFFWRLRRSWPNTRATFRGAPMWPIIGLIVGGLLFVGCAAWLLAKNSADISKIQGTLSRYVLPRHITEQQEKVIAEFLQQHPSQVTSLEAIKHSEEASSFRGDIQRALTAGGWTIAGIKHVDQMREGLTTRLRRPPNTKVLGDNVPDAQKLFNEAMKLAGITIEGSQSGGGGPDSTYEFVVQIGHRRMDDGGLIFISQEIRNMEAYLAELKDREKRG